LSHQLIRDPVGQEIECEMTKPYSVAFKQKMVQRLTGKNAISAIELSRETGVRRQNLSRWLQEARSLPYLGEHDPKARGWTVEEKARIVAEAAKLTGEQLTAYLERGTSEAGRFRALANGTRRGRSGIRLHDQANPAAGAEVG
jgi:transposase-like protein